MNRDLEVLRILNDNGFSAYIVGGYVRDKMLGINSNDADIATSATPRDMINIFDNISSTNDNYGSVSILYKNTKYEITTYRKDIKYIDNRRPSKVIYVDDIKKDLIRRDFTVNTFCMDLDGNIYDFLNVRDDLDNRVIRCVGNARYRLKEDALRILRAIRFATVLNFDIDDNTMYYIKKYGYLVGNLSRDRIKSEINKILSGVNRERGRDLLIFAGIDKYIGINNIKDVVLCDDIIGIWAQFDCSFKFSFNKNEIRHINSIKRLLCNSFIDSYDVYKYGLYVCMIVSKIRGISSSSVTDMFNKLPINNINDLCIDGNDICNILNINKCSFVGDVLSDIEKKVVYGELCNDREIIVKYILENFS